MENQCHRQPVTKQKLRQCITYITLYNSTIFILTSLLIIVYKLFPNICIRLPTPIFKKNVKGDKITRNFFNVLGVKEIEL